MPDPIILPTTVNDELILVALFNVVFPETLKLDLEVFDLIIVLFPLLVEDLKVD